MRWRHSRPGLRHGKNNVPESKQILTVQARQSKTLARIPSKLFKIRNSSLESKQSSRIRLEARGIAWNPGLGAYRGIDCGLGTPRPTRPLRRRHLVCRDLQSTWPQQHSSPSRPTPCPVGRRRHLGVARPLPCHTAPRGRDRACGRGVGRGACRGAGRGPCFCRSLASFISISP